MTGEQFHALGNSWAVPVVRWIGARINAAVEHIKHERKLEAKIQPTE